MNLQWFYVVDKYAGFYNDLDTKCLFFFSFSMMNENNARQKDM